MKKKNTLKFLFYLYCIVMVYLLLTPIEIDFERKRNVNLQAFKTIKDYITYTKNLYINNYKGNGLKTLFIFKDGVVQDFFANIFFFSPISLGLAAYHSMRKIHYAIFVSFLIPVFIEFWQYTMCPTRSFDLDDIILNFIGLMLGYFIFMLFNFFSKHNKKN